MDAETLQNTYEQKKNTHHLPDSVMSEIKILRLVKELKSIWIVYLYSILVGRSYRQQHLVYYVQNLLFMLMIHLNIV